MKLWEVMKALEENPEKKFALKGRNQVIGTTRLARGVTVAVDDSQFQYVAELEFSDNWEEVKQPVPWQEAIEAWMNEKTVRCEIGEENYIFSRSTDEFKDDLGAVTRIQLYEGTWYIEEEVE